MITAYIPTSTQEVLKERMPSQDGENVSIAKGDRKADTLAAFFQIFTNNMFTTTRSAVVVVYLVHNIFRGSTERKKRLLGNRYELAQFLPVCCGVDQLEGEESKEDEKTFVYGFTFSLNVPLDIGIRIPIGSIG